MTYIKVWCEYDINGDFGGDNNEAVYEVPPSLTPDEINSLLEFKFKYLWDEVNEDNCEETFLESGLLGWEFINITKLD